MKPIDSSLNEFSRAGWQVLGELELPASAEANGMSETWLKDTLIPLSLHADFLTKILKSAQDAVTRATRPVQATRDFEHIHIFIFVPAVSTSKGQNWGFFRIEKIESTTADESHPDHTIEFFLYREEQ